MTHIDILVSSKRKETPMKLSKICSCGTQLTTRNIRSKGITQESIGRFLWVNCKACDSTLVLRSKNRVSRPNWMRALISVLALVLFAPQVKAEQAVECKEAIRAFNRIHAPTEIGVWVHDNAADPVVRSPKGHKQSSAAQAASMGALRVCIKTGALGRFVYMSNQDGPGGKVCQIISADSMSATCSPNEARVVFKAVK